MKKILSLVLALAMLLGIVPAFGEAPAASALPAVGDMVEGFEVKEIREFGLIGAQLVYFEHASTGAKLLYVANDDTNRAFQLTFPTRMENDTGLPHVFEHGTLSGSVKYPSTDLWMNVGYQTYNTYMNAYTADAMTCFPVASLSEAQLLKLADFYTDLCLNPLIMTEEKIYRTEAWRYEMADADADLTLNGTVYSEMLGSFNLNRAALNSANKATFPGASISNDSGGNPDHIPEMTWQDLKDYHNKYYHPSNCLALLYGSFSDYTAFLKLLNEAFAPFDRQEISLEETGYTRITEPVFTHTSWRMAEGSDPANQTAIYYYIVCPGMRDDVAQERLIDHACDLLSDSASPLMQALKKAFPTGSFGIGREVAAPDDAVAIVATGVNDGDEEQFKAIVDEYLADTAKNGFGAELVDNIVTALKFNAKLANENSNPVDGILERIAYAYSVSGDIFNYVDGYESMDNIEAENEQGLLAGAVQTWLVNPELYTVTVTVPAPGEQEVHDAALAASLAEIKAGMSAEEIQAIVDATNAADPDEDTSAMVEDLTAVSLATLPEEVKKYDLRDTTDENGLRRVESVAGVDGISYIMLCLDAMALPQEDIHYMRLFTRLLGKMDTDAHTWEELDALVSRYLYSSTFGVFASGYRDNFHPYMVAEWYSLDEDLEAGYSLAEEILYRTQFTDTETLLKRIQDQKNFVRQQINGAAYQVLMYRQFAVTSTHYRYSNYLNFLDYYDFLSKLETLMEENPDEVVAGLQRVQQFFANRSGAVAAIAASEESLALNRPLTDAFFAKLDNTAREAVEYDLPVPAKKEALIADINVQFNGISVNWKDIDPEIDGAAYDVVGQLVADKLLIPELRDRMGVYTPFCVSSNETFYLLTYRDPNLAETFTFYDGLPDMINNLDVDQSTIDKYILSTYSGLAMPEGEMSGATSALNNYINGVPEDLKLQNMKAVKSVTPETVKAFALSLADILNTGVRGTAGSAGAINANAEMFDAVYNPFNSVDLSAIEFEDVPEGHEKYESVHFAVDNQFMAPLSDTVFGVDEPATVGDFLASVYALMGGPAGDPEGARAWLAGYELVDADADLSAPLTEDLFCLIMQAIGVGYTTDTPDTVVPRGDLADVLMQVNEMMSQQGAA
ncbi:MAG: insulinase family protein [Clostridia bacterium]|nr:insulinase family protein [Clostridia bacterium]